MSASAHSAADSFEGRPAGRLLCIGGLPGSGKTTVGRLVAEATRAALIDLDSVTTPLVEAVAATMGVPLALDRPPLSDLREPRYGCLAAVLRDSLAAGCDVVAVAPFSREARDASEWRRWGRALGASAATVAWLDLPLAAARGRAKARGLARDVAARDADQLPHTPGGDDRAVDRDGLDLVVDATASPLEVAGRILARWIR